MVANLRESKAFSPGQITGFFQICDQPENPLQKGSRGAGVCLTQGVSTHVVVAPSSQTSVTILMNGHVTHSAWVSQRVIDAFLSLTNRYYNVQVTHHINVPIGCGFGSSGAGALSLALVLNETLDLHLSSFEAAQIAHVTEINCKTGLGTVIAETFGGIGIRVKAGAPNVGKIKTVIPDEEYLVACLNLGVIPTKTILSDTVYRQRINRLGGELVEKLDRCPTVCNLMEFSRQFAEHVGLISERIRAILNETDKAGLKCSLAMLGETVFSLVRLDQLEQIQKIYSKYAPSEQNIIVTNIDFKGARLL